MSIAVTEIDDALADAGFETSFSGFGDTTSYMVRSEGHELELLDAVDAAEGVFDASNLAEAISYRVAGHKDVTRAFESVETVADFIAVVRSQFN